MSWFFGPDILRKRLLLEEQDVCKKIRNPLWMDFGIHANGTGWIFKGSGPLGLEITLKSGAYIRLGSDQPNYLAQTIEDAKDNSGR